MLKVRFPFYLTCVQQIDSHSVVYKLHIPRGQQIDPTDYQHVCFEEGRGVATAVRRGTGVTASLSYRCHILIYLFPRFNEKVYFCLTAETNVEKTRNFSLSGEDSFRFCSNSLESFDKAFFYEPVNRNLPAPRRSVLQEKSVSPPSILSSGDTCQHTSMNFAKTASPKIEKESDN